MFSELRVPAFCPVCSMLMKGRSTPTYYDWGCCIHCFIEFLENSENRQKKWKEGWRPSKDEVDIFLKKLCDNT